MAATAAASKVEKFGFIIDTSLGTPVMSLRAVETLLCDFYTVHGLQGLTRTTLPTVHGLTRAFLPGAHSVTRRMSSSGPRLLVWSSAGAVAYLCARPWTPGSVVVEPSPGGAEGGSVFDLTEEDYLSLLLGARQVSQLLCGRLGVRRCALVSRPHPQRPPQILVLPLHGLDQEWRPHLAADQEFNATDPGYCTSKSAPRWSDEQLTQVQGRIKAALPDPRAPPDLTFLGADPAHPGLFSRIVRGEETQWRVWQDAGHVAFLTPFPNTPGLTVLVPRRPLSSDIFSLDLQDYVPLVKAAQAVARLLLRGLGVSGVGMIFEGFEIDYAHVKLMPLCSAGSGTGGRGQTGAAPFFSTYPGFVSSEDGPVASAHGLSEIHTRLTSQTQAAGTTNKKQQ